MIMRATILIKHDYGSIKALKLKTIKFKHKENSIDYEVDAGEYAQVLKYYNEKYPEPVLKWYQVWERIKKHFTEL